MKTIIMTALFLISSVALASEVKITSFLYMDKGIDRSPTAELCGKLVNPTGKNEIIKITVDPGSKNPGYYYATTGKDGQFCKLVATYTGRADAVLD